MNYLEIQIHKYGEIKYQITVASREEVMTTLFEKEIKEDYIYQEITHFHLSPILP